MPNMVKSFGKVQGNYRYLPSLVNCLSFIDSLVPRNFKIQLLRQDSIILQRTDVIEIGR